jgi:glycosyltransferase involved in cell wall biosynthesis
MTNPTAAEREGLRVLFLTHAFPRWPGDAAGSFILRLARGLRNERVDVTVLTPHAPDLPLRDTIDGIRVVRFRYAPASLETLAYTGTMAEQVRSSWLARGALASLLGAGLWRVVLERYGAAPAILHAHWWFPSGTIGASISALTSLPLVTTMHGSDVRLARTIKAARRGLGWVLGRSRVSTTVSRWLATEAHALAPSRAAPLVAPMPAATELFFPRGGRSPTNLLYVGRLNAQKGIELLLQAVARARCRATLDVVGDGPDSESLRALSSSLGIADRVVWRGTLPQPDLPPLYRSAAALVVPSRDEGLGLVAVEALLCETPVIAFDSGGLRDIVQHEINGLLVKDFSAEALSFAIEQLLENPSRASDWGKAGRRSVLGVFAPEAVARNYARIYRGALTGSDAHT